MPDKKTIEQELISQKLLPLFYHDSETVSLRILQALYDAGIRLVEYTNRGAAALKNFEVLRKIAEREIKDLYIGIGTVKTKQQAIDYINAGAHFVVAPSVNKEVGEVVQQKDLLWIPGCMTPTEIATAEEAGASLVKIFPGQLLGPEYIKSIKDLFPGLRFIVTGGVEPEEENMKAWFGAGAIGVGMGSRLISKNIIETENYKALQQAAEAALRLVKAIASS